MRIPLDPPPYTDLLETLFQNRLTPVIVFLPSRRGCDEAVDSFRSGRLGDLPMDHQDRIEDLVDGFDDEAEFIRQHRQFSLMLKRGVAAHHAGQLPAWKHVVEKAMSAGLLRAVFATSTLAAGIDMPARSVVITASSQRSDEGHRDIKAFELAQMTGRAGRRGRDKVGFAVFIPGPFQDINVIVERLLSPPEPLESSFSANYTMVLNLLQQLSPEAARELVERSFRQFQNLKLVEKLRPRVARAKAVLDADAKDCPAGDRSKTFAAYQTITRELGSARKQVKRLRRFTAETIGFSPEAAELHLNDLERAQRALERYETNAGTFACSTCPQSRTCAPRAAEMTRQWEEYETLAKRLAAIENGLWDRFEDCVEVLRHYDYLTEDWRPTQLGEWAARLRVENTLFVAELLREGYFNVPDGRHLAALCGALAAEDREFPMSDDATREDYLRPLRKARGIAHAIATVQERHDIYCPMYIDYDAARLLWTWADGEHEWEALLERTEAVEGDVVRLILRTSDLLGQLSGLSDTHPELAIRARAAIRLIRRPPVED